MELILNPTLIINEFEDGDMVIIDQQKEMTHLLNKSAALIITIFKDRVNTVEKCVEIFMKEIDQTEIDHSQVLFDIQETIKELLERRRLIEK